MKLKGTILIVDDEQINLDFFDVMLSKLGFKVVKATNGEEALEKVKEKNPDLVILDNIMPKLSGWEVTKILKSSPEYKKYRDMPIIMFSAMDDVKDKIEGLELGVDDYITKPFNFSEVLARIRAVLRNRELVKQITRRERRLAVVESLNNSLIFFTRHIKKPITSLIEKAKKIDPNDRESVKELIDELITEGNEILVTMRGLEDEINELETRKDRIKRGDVSLEELEKKFEKHLKNWKKRQKKFEEVEG